MVGHHHQVRFEILNAKYLEQQDTLAPKQASDSRSVPWYRRYYRYAAKINRQLILTQKRAFFEKRFTETLLTIAHCDHCWSNGYDLE